MIMVREKLKYPSLEAVDSVLTKIGVDPTTRYSGHDQDYEYTTCKLEELEQYIDLYTQPETTDKERRLLGCYFLECLNEYIGNYGKIHGKQNSALDLLFGDLEIHDEELDYWSDTSDPDENNWWYITQFVKERKNT